MQKKRVIGRAFFPSHGSSRNTREVLLTMMASMNADDSALSENIQTLTSIVESFMPSIDELGSSKNSF